MVKFAKSLTLWYIICDSMLKGLWCYNVQTDRQTDRQTDSSCHCERSNPRNSLNLFGALRRNFVFRSLNPAFTLAEVLITLGIIGVVAAITIPSLIQNAGRQELQSRLKKSTAILAQAFEEIKADNGNTLVGAFSSRADLIDQLSQKINTTKTCSAATYAQCFPDYYLPGLWPRQSQEGMILSDGAMIATSIVFDSACATTNSNGADFATPACANILIDINGSKKPHMLGKDVFDFYVTASGVVPSCDDTTGWCRQNYGCGLGAGSTCKCFNGGQLNTSVYGGQGCTGAALLNPDAYFNIAFP